MRNGKKILSVLMTLVMAIGMFSVRIFAAEAPEQVTITLNIGEEGKVEIDGEEYAKTAEITRNKGAVLVYKIKPDEGFEVAALEYTEGGKLKEDSYIEDNVFAPGPANEDIKLRIDFMETGKDFFTVTFNANGHGTEPKPAQADPMQTITEPDPLTAEGYVFGGWYKDKDCSDDQKFDFSTPIRKDITLYAKWTPEEPPAAKYTLTFETNGGSTLEPLKDQEAGTEVDLSKYAPTKADCTFEGWYEDKELSKKVTTVKMDGDKTVYAKWTEDEKPAADKYTLTFETNGGSAIDPVKDQEKGTVVKLEDAKYTPTKSGYVFDGWYEDKELKGSAVKEVTLDADKTIYAKWIKTYTLTFETNGGDKIDPVTAAQGESIDLSKYTPKKTGYTFSAWYSDKNLTTKVTKVTMTGDKTVYAKWTQTGTNTTSGANTAQNSNLALWLGVGAAGLAALAVLVLLSKKNSGQNS